MSDVVIAVALPLLAAFLLPLISRTSASAGSIAGPLVLLISLLVLVVHWPVFGGEAFSVALGGFAPPLGIVFYVDGLSLLFALSVPAMVLLMWPWGRERVREQTLSLVLSAAGTGLALSGDLFNIYVFYELVAVASYGLVVSRGTGAAYTAGFRYLILSAFGSVMALTGIALVYTATGTLNLAQLAQVAPQLLTDTQALAAFVLILLGLGVKAELFPVNAWVPEVYATAERRVSGLLAGLVSKLAVIVILRLLILVFPSEDARQVLLVLGVLGVISGELAAWRAPDLARMLAWSSIAQLGMVFVAFSISGTVGIVAGIAVALHHLIAKPALFLLAERWGGALDRLAGVSRQSPLATGLFILFALSLVGVPPLPGFWAKFLLLSGLAETGNGLFLAAMGVVLVATVIEANYLFRAASSMMAAKSEPPGDEEPRLSHARLDLATVTILAVVLIASVGWLQNLGATLEVMAAQVADTAFYVEHVFTGQGGVTP